MLKDDFIIKDTENVLRYLSRLLFDADLEFVEIDDEDEEMSYEALLYSDLKKLVSQSNINKAENLLFEKLDDAKTDKMLLVALKFYNGLSRLNDEELDRADFSREEILDGVHEIEKMANG